MASILLIDDEEQVRDFLSTVISKRGHSLDTARDGREGLGLLRNKEYDVVVTDLFMDTQDGISTIMEMRNDFPSIPVIAISGGSWSSGTDFLEIAKKMGVAYTFSKPIALTELFEAIDELTGPKE